MVIDPISDFLVRIKNAQAIGKSVTTVPYSALLWEIAQTLERTGYIKRIERHGKRVHRTIEISLNYLDDGKGRIDALHRVSRQSRRVYKKVSELYPTQRGFGMKVLSTSKGLMTDKEARENNVGGEVLFEVW